MNSRSDSIAKQLTQIREEGNKRVLENNGLLYTSPINRIKSAFKRQIEKDEKYRMSVLRNVATFASLSDQHVLSAAQNMEDHFYPRGTVIIKQDSVGDSFFVIEEGEVLVTRKNNPDDPNETPKELARLGPNSYLGEIALMTQEPRTATAVVISPVAKCLRMTKAKFDEVMANCNAEMFGERKELGRAVVDRVPLFQSLPASKKKQILDLMVPMNFMPNTYICKQGSVGNMFYIITEGVCKVTVNTDQGSEKDIAKLVSGDFFGEVALIEASNQRTANVVSVSHVSCMTLSRVDFTELLDSVRSSLVENSAMRSLAAKKVKKDLRGMTTKRRVSMMDENNVRNMLQMGGYLKRLFRFMIDSLYCSLYSHLYREMILRPICVELYGSTAKSILIMHNNRDAAVHDIMSQAIRISKIDPSERSSTDHAFMLGILSQKNKLRDKMCKGWSSDKLLSLARSCRIVRVKPLTKVVEMGATGTSAYLLLRGCARVFTANIGEGVSKTSTKYEEDIFAGDVFGDSALEGVRSRLTTVLTLTSCDLMVVEYLDYASAKTGNSQTLSVEDRYQFLVKTSLFRGWAPNDLYRLASVLQREDIAKGAILTKKNGVAKYLSFLMEGRVDVVTNVDQQQVITSVNRHECFGESSILSVMTEKPRKEVAEACFMIAGTHISVLNLLESHFSLIDSATLDTIFSSFIVKNSWRVKRIEQYRAEKHNEAKLKNSPKGSSPVPLELSVPPIHLTPVAPAAKLLNAEKIPFDQLNDIPTMIDAGIDPILAMSTCRNQKDLRRVHNAIKEITRPKSARSKPAASQSSTRPLSPAMSPGGNKSLKRTPSSPAAFMQMAAREASASNLRLPEVLPPRRPNTAAAQPRGQSAGHRYSDVAVAFDPSHDLQKPITPKCLMGSARIPSAKSFCEFNADGRKCAFN